MKGQRRNQHFSINNSKRPHSFLDNSGVQVKSMAERKIPLSPNTERARERAKERAKLLVQGWMPMMDWTGWEAGEYTQTVT